VRCIAYGHGVLVRGPDKIRPVQGQRQRHIFIGLPMKLVCDEVECTLCFAVGDFEDMLLDSKNGDCTFGLYVLINLHVYLARCEVFAQDTEDAGLWVMRKRARVDGDEGVVELGTGDIGGMQDGLGNGERTTRC